MHLIQPLKINASTAFRLPQGVLEKVDQVCDEQDLTRSQIFRRSIMEFLKSQKIETPSAINDTTQAWSQQAYKRAGQ